MDSVSLAQYLMNQDLIDQLAIAVVPKTIGSGKPLSRDTHRLKLTNAKTFKSGLALLYYEPVRLGGISS